MKNLIIFATALTLSACMSPKQVDGVEDIYSARNDCNGELVVSQSIILVDSDANKTNEPEITSECVPPMYDPQTDFEKENRRDVHNK